MKELIQSLAPLFKKFTSRKFLLALISLLTIWANATDKDTAVWQSIILVLGYCGINVYQKGVVGPVAN